MDFYGRHYPRDLILQTVRWYLCYSQSYRDMKEILEERGVKIDHATATLYRWLQERDKKAATRFFKIKYLICGVFFAVSFLWFGVSQNTLAIAFASSYTISIDGNEVGHLKRTVMENGNVQIKIFLKPLTDSQRKDCGLSRDFRQFREAQVLSLQDSFHNLLSIITPEPVPGEASALPDNEIVITLAEPPGQPPTITYTLLGNTYIQDMGASSEGLCVILAGAREVYTTDESGLLNVRFGEDEDENEKEDEGIEGATQLDCFAGTMGDIFAASLGDAHHTTVQEKYLMFGAAYEQVLTQLASGRSCNSGLLLLISPMFPDYIIGEDQSIEQIVPGGFGQELVYCQYTNTITQKDPDNDPNPCNATTVFQLDSNGLITSIKLNDSEFTIIFSARD